MNRTPRGSASRGRALLLAGLAASVLGPALLAWTLRGSDGRAIEPVVASGARAPVPQRLDLEAGRETRSAAREASAIVATRAADPARFPARPADAIRALARSLADGTYERRSFEAEARARLAGLSDDALAPDGARELVHRDPAVVVARATLVRISALPRDARRDRVRGDLQILRACTADDSMPRGVREQAGSALAALGDDGDRARLLVQLADATAPRSAAAARIALERLEGPGAGLVLVDELAAELERRGDGPVLALASSWARASGSTLLADERSLCADTLAQIAGRESLAPSARARVLDGLAVLDPDRAAGLAGAWLGDPATAPDVARSACTSVRAGELDAGLVLALASDPALAAERRLEIATAFLGSARSEAADPTHLASFRGIVDALDPRAAARVSRAAGSPR